ncbi:MAG: hypothetical protein EOP51_19075 [Sphingobacteriales bacterium]|nr:MAG: hypothetical protein EOP51_19075 [Sphingobacteriales bacterium]
MNKKVNIICLAVLLVLGCRSNSVKKHIPGADSCLSAVNIADKEGLLADSKWHMYCLQCDDTVSFNKAVVTDDTIVTYGQLDLRLVDCEKKGDTVELYYGYYYKGTIVCDQRTVFNYRISGIIYGHPYEKPFAFIGAHEGGYVWDTRFFSRLEEPLQPQVVNYMKLNKNKLNNWLRQQAIKRNVIQ